MTEPFADPDKLRAGFGIYETALGTRPAAEPPRLFERSSVPTLLLYGPEDHVIQRDFPLAARWPSQSGSGRSSSRAPGTSCSGSVRTC